MSREDTMICQLLLFAVGRPTESPDIKFSDYPGGYTNDEIRKCLLKCQKDRLIGFVETGPDSGRITVTHEGVNFLNANEEHWPRTT